MDIMKVLSNNERIIVFSSEEDSRLYTWNQSDTFQCWRPTVCGTTWEEVAVLTQSGYGPKTFEQARQVAIDWHLAVI